MTKEERRKYDRDRYHLTKEYLRERYKEKSRLYRERGGEEYKKYRAKYDKEYLKKNTERLRTKSRERTRRWRKNNEEKNKRQRNTLKRNRLKTDLQYKIACVLRTRLWIALKNKQKKGSAVKLLGCSMEGFVKYFETLFAEGMTWENHGQWHIDHIKPLSKFDLTDAEQLKIACHFTNLQPLWAKDNISKGGRTIIA